MTCPLCQRRTPETGLLCAPCRDRLGRWLHDIEAEVQLLSAVPSMAQAHGTRGGTLAAHRAPARIDALTLADTRPWTDSALGTLHRWANRIRHDRHLVTELRPTVTTERRLLTRHLDHAAAQPYINDLAADLSALRAALRRTNTAPTTAPIGTCPMPHCTGPIWRQPQQHTMWRTTADRCTAHTITLHDGPAQCAHCGTTWTGPDIARLTLILEHEKREAARPHTHDGRPMYTAAELVHAGHASSISNVRVRAHRAGHRATHGHYDPQLFTDSKATA